MKALKGKRAGETARSTANDSPESNREPDESQVIEFETPHTAPDKGEIHTPHPLTKIIPPMSAKDREALKADMLVRGLRVPILRSGSLIIDGINRYEICQKFGVPLHFEDYDGDGEDKDILAEIVSRNVPRRHLTTKQRAAIAAELATMGEGGDKRSDHYLKSRSEKISQTQAAKMMNVSLSSLQAAKRKKRKAEPVKPESDRDTLQGKAEDRRRHKPLSEFKDGALWFKFVQWLKRNFNLDDHHQVMRELAKLLKGKPSKP